MATLHMDVESVRSTQSKMVSEKETMQGELQNLTNTVNSTVGTAWIGNSAEEFRTAYETLRDQINTQFESLSELAQNLATEIAQWEDMAARMG